MTGVFITFEGGEGSGKSTQIKLLQRWFASVCPEREIVTTREPGGTDEAELIRRILVTGAADKLTVEAEALLMIAARAEHVHSLIKPALKRGAIVLCDRFSDSTLVYQGLAHGLSVDRLIAIHQFAFDDLQPDLTFLLDVPAELGLQRARKRQEQTQPPEGAPESRFEDKGLAFHEAVRKGFLHLAQRFETRYIVIDASASEQQSDEQVKNHIISRLNLKITTEN